MKTNTKVLVLPERERHLRELCRLESNAEAAEVWQALGGILGGTYSASIAAAT